MKKPDNRDFIGRPQAYAKALEQYIEYKNTKMRKTVIQISSAAVGGIVFFQLLWYLARLFFS